MTIKVNILVEL